jgi:uncharacterized protein YodC (DUF2158 family)
MTRLFKKGNRVQYKSGGPIMEVLKYVEKKNPLQDRSVSNHWVKCVWYDKNFERKEAVFHQNSLNRVHWPVTQKNANAQALSAF